MDSLTETQWNEVARRYDALDYAARSAACYAAWDAAGSAASYAAGSAYRDAAGSAAGSAACYAARSAYRDAAGSAAGDAAGVAPWYAAGVAPWYATYELIGMHTLLNDCKTLLFVPLFGDL
jgi:hypothetical protein